MEFLDLFSVLMWLRLPNKLRGLLVLTMDLIIVLAIVGQMISEWGVH